MRDWLHLLGRTRTEKTKHWYEPDQGNARLVHDRALVRAFYPTLSYRLNFKTEQIIIKGLLILRSECGVPTKIELEISLSDYYPKEEPAAYDAGNRFPHDANHHFSREKYPTGIREDRCCLWLGMESEWEQGDPDGIIKFLHQVALFFERQLIYEADPSNGWPWGARSHREVGYAEYIREILGGTESVKLFTPAMIGQQNIPPHSRCPCDKGRKFKHCHLPIIQKLIGGFAPEKLVAILAIAGEH